MLRILYKFFQVIKWIMVMTRPPSLTFQNFLMKNRKLTNKGLIIIIIKLLHKQVMRTMKSDLAGW